MNIPASNMIISGDSLYVYSVEYSNQTSKNTVTYAIIDVKKKRVVSRKFITDGTELDIGSEERNGRKFSSLCEVIGR